MKRHRIVACIVLIVAVAPLAAWWLRGGEVASAPASASGAVSRPLHAEANTSGGGYDVIRWTSPEQGFLLSTSIPLGKLPLAEPLRQALSKDIADWFSAYGDPEPFRFMSMLQAGGIASPASWADSKEAQDLWTRSIGNIQGIDLDPTKSFAQVINLRSLDDPLTGTQRCGRRDQARPFLSGVLKQPTPGVEVVLIGSVIDPETKNRVQVSIAIAFVWNAEVNKWVTVRTCLRDFPNAYQAMPPVL